MSSIEEKIWAYIDGSCSDEEKQTISELIQHDDNYRKVYEELSAFNKEISLIGLDEPSLAFTYNVLESIRTETAGQPLKTKVNTIVVKIIAGFFITVISGIIVYTLLQVNWSENTTSGYTIPKLNLMNDRTLKVLAFFDILVGALLLDLFLRRKSGLKHF